MEQLLKSYFLHHEDHLQYQRSQSFVKESLKTLFATKTGKFIVIKA